MGAQFPINTESKTVSRSFLFFLSFIRAMLGAENNKEIKLVSRKSINMKNSPSFWSATLIAWNG
eukprot:snap_masked-scaffold_33-processed-gene-3.10-mRNA-1 protein AED:1.00 eAED:1.00 QI:0/0/0/0/1/1/2/0/63